MHSNEGIYKGVLAFRLENTKYAVKFIERNEALLNRMLKAGKDKIENEAFKWAREHGNEFGNRFETELYDVFWDKVWQKINKSDTNL